MKIKASDLLRYEITPFLYGVLYSRIMPVVEKNVIPKFFYIYTSFRTSKAVASTKFSLATYSNKLNSIYNKLSGNSQWKIHKADNSKVELRFYIENNLNINSSSFYNLIYQKLRSEKWLYTVNLSEEKKSFVRGYMESRGSVDTSLKLFAQDYFYSNSFELKRVLLLTDDIGIPISYANFNARNMQPQFLSGYRKRNAQFRINLFYYAKEIGFMNEYKALVFENAYGKFNRIEKDGVLYYDVTVPSINNSVQFINYLNFFTNNIYNKQLTQKTIESLRSEIGFDKSIGDLGPTRNRSIVLLFTQISEDKCALCGTKKTFTKSNGREAFEIHHVIPFHKGLEYDNIANFVKLCSTCHRSLKKGNAQKQYQIDAVMKILNNYIEVYEYTSSALGIQEIPILADKIVDMLG
jgi:hypothetical protein